MSKLVNWFQIPAVDLDRATRFYTAVLGVGFHRLDDAMGRHAFFAVDPARSELTGGEIVQTPHQRPAPSGGVTIFLHAPGGIAAALAAVPQAGGKIALPRTEIGAMGAIAIMIDSEGNAIGLHRSKA